MDNPNPNPSFSIFPIKQKYDPDEFLTASADGKGHSAKFWFRGPVGLDRQIEIVMSSRKFPYKTPSDLLRHALVRHLMWLNTLETDIPSVMSQVYVVLEMMKEEQYHQDFNMVFEEISRMVQRYLGGGHQEEALRIVSQCRDKFDLMPEGFWKKQYMDELMKRFGYLFEGNGVSIFNGQEI